jgi:hypothetical protein
VLLNLLNYKSVVRCRVIYHKSLDYLDWHRQHDRCYNWFFSWRENRKASREERKEHTKNFNEIYKKFACVWIEKEFDGSFVLKIPKDPDHYRAYRMMAGIDVERPKDTDVQHLTNSDLALDNLKKYPSIHEPWEEVDSKLTELNGCLTLGDDIVYTRVDEIQGLLEKFRKEIEVLINLIDAGHILKGKCEVGY